MREYDQLIANRKASMDEMRSMINGKALEGEQLDRFNALKNEVTSFNDQIAALEQLETLEKADKPINDVLDEKVAFENYIRRGEVKNISTTTSGGYLVPTRLHDEIVKKIGKESVIMQLAEVINVTGPMDIVAEANAATSYWTKEGAKTTESDPTFGKIALVPKKLTTLIKVTEEALADSAFDIEKYLIEHVGKNNAKEIDKQGVIGTQSDALEGIITTASVFTASATNSITYADIVNLYTGVGDYKDNGSWIVSSEALTQIMLMVDGAGHYIFTSPKEDEPIKLLGRPLYVCGNMDAVATGKKPVIFGDISYYKVAQRQGLTVQRLDERYADDGVVGFRFVQRLDGKLSVAEAVKVLKMA